MKNLTKFFIGGMIAFAMLTNGSAKAEVVVNLTLTGQVGYVESQVTGLTSGNTAQPGYGNARTYFSTMTSWTTLTLTIYDLPATDDVMTFQLAGYCGLFELFATGTNNNGETTWATTTSLTISSQGNCPPVNVDVPWPTGKRQIYSAPYKTGPSGDKVLKYEATRSVLLQIGASTLCSGTCTTPGETCSPNRLLINSLAQGGTVNKTTGAARDPKLNTQGYSEDSYAPATPSTPTTARVVGQLYCICVDFTKP